MKHQKAGGSPADSGMPSHRQRAVERRKHLKAEVGLSSVAHRMIRGALENGRESYEAIAAAVLAATGEKIGKSSIARYYALRVARPLTAGEDTELMALAARAVSALEKIAEALLHGRRAADRAGENS